MLFMPTNVYPSTLGGLGNGTIDAQEPLTVSWDVIGSPALMTAFSITIYQNNEASTQLYTTGKLTDNCPFYGVNYAGVQQTFSYTIPAATLASAGITNGNEYKFIIRQWWSDTEYVDQVSASVFKTRAVPEISIDSFPSPITGRSAAFTATYSQAQGDALMWARWRIAEASSTDTPLYDSGDIYGTAELRANYDGFFTGTTYAVRCTVETVNGIQADSGWVSFEVSYPTQTMEGSVKVTQPRGISALEISWPGIVYIPGIATGDYTITDEVLNLPSSGSVSWSTSTGKPMSLAAPWTVFWRGQTLAGGQMFSLTGPEGEAVFTLNEDGPSLTYAGEEVFSAAAYWRSTDIWTVILTPSGISIQQQGLVGGLYPSTELYPSETLYPRDDTVLGLKRVIQDSLSAALSWSIEGLTLYGQQDCDYFAVEAGEMSAEEISQAMGNLDYAPEMDWSGDTLFYANFKDGLTAGSTRSLGEEVTGFSIYRIATGESALVHIADMPLETTKLTDYSAVSQQEYTYLMFAAGENSFPLAPVRSPSFTGCFWNWTLLECTEDEAGVYHVAREYTYRYNVATGSMTNNNGPNLLENFTPYPLIQPKSANYRTGTLSALIGKVDTGEYSDTLKLRDAIMALSVTVNTLFLKDRKGDLIRVRTSAPVAFETMDNTREQAQTMTLSWAETGSTAGVSILSQGDLNSTPQTSTSKTT